MIYQTRSQFVKDARASALQMLAILIALLATILPAFWGMAQPPPQASTVAGLQDGWAVNPSNDQVLLTSAIANRMACGGAKWVRVPFRIGGHRTWDNALLGVYDQVVANCLNAGLTVIGLVNHESWPGQQKDWTAKNNECLGLNGDNTYLQNFVNKAVLVLAKRYHAGSQVTHWEIWNEPDVWTSTNPLGCPSNRNFIGGSYIYPSNFAWALRRSFEAFRVNNLANAKVISGGLLCADLTGTCDDSGRVYLTSTYDQGTTNAGWNQIKATYGTFPVNGWGQHVYVSGCCRLDDPFYFTVQPFLIGANLYKFYLDCFHDAAVALDGDATKKVFVTEWGWATNPGGMSQADQAFNVGVAMDVYNATLYIGAATYFTLHENAAAGLFYGLRLESDAPKQSWNTFCTKNGGACCTD